MLEAIYSSKLYLSSSRQLQIRAAIEHPINMELVTQLKSYLDPEYQADLKEAEKADQEAEIEPIQPSAEQDDGETANDIDDQPSQPSSHAPSGSRPHGSSLSEKFAAFEKGESSDLESEASEPTSNADTADSQPADLEPVEESSNVGISNTSEDLPQEVKDVLSSNPSTSDFVRIRVQNGELWIYYNDAVNLNNIMAQVIESLIDGNMDMLSFNRLARSDNAIVFEIASSNSDVNERDD